MDFSKKNKVLYLVNLNHFFEHYETRKVKSLYEVENEI